MLMANLRGRNIGRSGEARTPDILVPNQARYQLRYTPMKQWREITPRNPDAAHAAEIVAHESSNHRYGVHYSTPSMSTQRL